MSSKIRRCVFGCESFRSLFSLPKEELSRHKWLEFVFGSAPQPSQTFYVCDNHFTDDCFLNLGMYQAGLYRRLTLGTGAVPTIRADGETGGTSQEASSESPPLIRPSVRSVGVQVTPTPVPTRTVSTQLSAGTLKVHRVRSKGVQATETQQHCLVLSSTQMKTSASGTGQRPLKRPRLEEAEDSMEDMDISDVLQPHDSPSTATSFTDLPRVIEKEPSALEDAKYIVFESSLREIFNSCPVCKRLCRVRRRKCGTFVSFLQKCPHCQYSRTWQSGPVIGSTPVGNLQLSAAVYFSGASFVNVARICKAMNLQIHQNNTFRRHSRSYLEPAIHHKWNSDQKILIENLKKKGKLAVSGGMRADSPGHRAKFGTYSLMDLESHKIVDMQLVQSSEVGGSHHMEKEGLCRCLDFLNASDLEVDYIITDRQPQVQKFLRERQVTQYYDVGHVVKGLSKRLDKLAKDKDCQVLKKWFPAIRKQMFCSASSTSGPETVAKWTSLLNHIPDFPQCAHPDEASRDPNKGLHPGTEAMHKVEKLLLNKRLLGDVAKLSSCHQMSSLESFHRLVLRFTPKISDFTNAGMMCRLFLAGMHQNENATQKRAVSKGKALFKVSYPKNKKGQGTATPLKTKTTFGYVEALMRLVCTDCTKFVAQLKTVPVPDDLCAQRASREDVSRFSRAEAGPNRSKSTTKLLTDPQLRTRWNDDSPAPAHNKQ